MGEEEEEGGGGVPTDLAADVGTLDGGRYGRKPMPGCRMSGTFGIPPPPGPPTPPLLPPIGCSPGIELSAEAGVVGVTPLYAESGVEVDRLSIGSAAPAGPRQASLGPWSWDWRGACWWYDW